MDEEQYLHRCHPFYGELGESSDLRVKIHSAVSDVAPVCVSYGHKETSTWVEFSWTCTKHCNDMRDSCPSLPPWTEQLCVPLCPELHLKISSPGHWHWKMGTFGEATDEWNWFVS